MINAEGHTLLLGMAARGRWVRAVGGRKAGHLLNGPSKLSSYLLLSPAWRGRENLRTLEHLPWDPHFGKGTLEGEAGLLGFSDTVHFRQAAGEKKSYRSDYSEVSQHPDETTPPGTCAPGSIFWGWMAELLVTGLWGHRYFCQARSSLETVSSKWPRKGAPDPPRCSWARQKDRLKEREWRQLECSLSSASDFKGSLNGKDGEGRGREGVRGG